MKRTTTLHHAEDEVIADAGGYFIGIEVEAALQELGAATSQATSNADNVFSCASPGGVSAFAGTIATLPGGAVLTYNVTSGQEGAMVPVATTQLAKVMLHNTTRGTSALISNCVTGTNTITLTANVPAGWALTDVITIASQTVSGTYSWIDLEITSGITGLTDVLFYVSHQSATANVIFILHPFEAFAASKLMGARTHVTNITSAIVLPEPIISSRISCAWEGSPTTVTIRVAGYLK